MDDDVYVKKLLEFIFIQKLRIKPEMTASESSFPKCLQTNDFPDKMLHIFAVRHIVMSYKWAFDLGNNIRDTMKSYHSYIMSVVCTCLKEHYTHRNVFDGFLCVCSCAKYFGEETLRLTGVDLQELNFDIVLETYYIVLKAVFLRRGGITRLIEFIHKHKYLTWNLDKIKFSTTDVSTAYLDEDILDKVKKELDNERVNLTPYKREIAGYSLAMTQNIILYTSVKLPNLPTEQELNKILLSGKPKATEEKETQEANLKLKPLNVVWQQYSKKNSDTKTNKFPEQKQDMTRYNNIIQAVMRHNASKASDIETSVNCIFPEADGIVKNLKKTIESLIKVLDEPDRE